jgi:hypothetical protein
MYGAGLAGASIGKVVLGFWRFYTCNHRSREPSGAFRAVQAVIMQTTTRLRPARSSDISLIVPLENRFSYLPPHLLAALCPSPAPHLKCTGGGNRFSARSCSRNFHSGYELTRSQTARVLASVQASMPWLSGLPAARNTLEAR